MSTSYKPHHDATALFPNLFNVLGKRPAEPFTPSRSLRSRFADGGFFRQIGIGLGPVGGNGSPTTKEVA